jgi:hypothetical protein
MSLGTPWQRIAGTPTHTLNPLDQTLSRSDTLRSLREGTTDEREKRVARQQQPRTARRIQHLAAQYSIGDRSLQHALFAINRAPRGVTTLAVPFDNSVLRPPYARTNPTAPTPTSALRFSLQFRFKRVRLFCDPTGCRSSALQGHLLNSTWKNDLARARVDHHSSSAPEGNQS